MEYNKNDDMFHELSYILLIYYVKNNNKKFVCIAFK